MNAQALSVTSVHRLHCKTVLKGFGSGCLLLLLFSISAFADTYYVSLSGSHTAPFTDWMTAATNIQTAIDVAVDGDTVLVSNGIYATGGRVVYGALTNRIAITKPVTVRSVNGPAMTIIQGAGPVGDSAVRCAYVGTNAVLAGFTLTNGATHSTGNSDREWYGGGVWCESSGVLSNCVLTGNLAYIYGGGACDGTLYNCMLTGNSAYKGGGAYDSTLYNCTLTGNSAAYGGGASGGALYNCIVYYNEAAFDANYHSSTFNYSCTTPYPGSLGNITSEPQLASFSHLAVGSPCRGAGHSDYATGTDIDGEAWRVPPSMGCDEVVAGAITGALSVSAWAAPTNVAVGFPIQFRADILGRTARSVWYFGDGTVLSNKPYAAIHAYASPGVYAVLLRAYNESYPQGITATVTVYVAARMIHYVKLGNATPIAPYTSWETAATNIQDAIDAADKVGALVLVSNGIYATGGRVVYGELTNRIAITKPVTVRSVNGPTMTIIQGAGSVDYDGSDVRCAYVGINAVLEGFTLTNGMAWSHDYTGGGALCESSGVLSNCVLTRNSVRYGGGAYGGTLYNCTLSGNWAHYGGGAYYSTLYNCTLTGNRVGWDGGGTYYSTLYNCTLTDNRAQQGGGAIGGALYNCRLTGNSADYSGGGVHDGTLFNCTLTGNSAYGFTSHGGGASWSTLYNCMLTGNSAYKGGGVFFGTLHNCTLTGNSAEYAGGAWYGTQYNCIVYYNIASSDSNWLDCILNYSCTTPDPGGIGNITNDPRFVNAAAGDYHLQPISPCINAGTNQDWMIGATDLDGNPRIDASGRVDMGAYEYQGPIVSAVTIWLSNAVPGRVDGGPDSAVELGVKFRSDVDGTIAGIRFYKAAANTGTHIGNLWTSNGALLATATFSNETVSGWQQALFATPVTIASNTVYVASYHANNGHYSCDVNYFSGKGLDNPPLHALANGVSGGNGVYRYGASSLFPNQTWHAANYYVDLVFQAKPAPTLTSLVVTPANPSILIGASQQFTATGTYSDGSAQDITSQATWTSSDTGVATINTRGLATGVSDGIPIISASLAGVTGSTLLTVQHPPSPIHYVSLSGAHVSPFTNWHTAATNIQTAIDVAVDGDTVLVSNGIYATGGRVVYGALTNRIAITKPVTVRSVNGPAMTIIQGAGPVGDSAVRCAYVGTNAVLAGFTLTNGATHSTGNRDREWYGGGVWCESSGVLSNCVLTGNSAAEVGGGAEGGTLYNCTLTGNSALCGGGASDSALSNCTLIGNSAAYSGGGSCWGTTLYNCTLSGNSASYYGGGAYGGTLYNCTLTGNSAYDGGGVSDGTLYHCTLTGNSAAYSGGGAYYGDLIGGTLYHCTLTGNSASYGGGASGGALSNCTLIGNSAAYYGGGSCWGTTLYNCTLTGNSASDGGGAYYSTLYNCIVYYNTASSDSNWLNCTLNYSCTTPDPGGVGNITNDPQFVNAAAGDYHLQSTSPCINAGTNQDWMIGATDLDGNPRIDASGRVDMGAYEYQGPIVSAVTIWLSNAVPGRVDGGPDSAVELGVKFRSDVDGTIAGIRFYKAAANTGTHIGNLWTSNGTLLATVTFTNETASGWQQALFATPVAITSNTVYVASYHANNGHYSADLNYFSGKGVDNPPLHALTNGVSGGNGVYRYGASSLFPNQTWNAANYWVDVVFQPASPPPSLPSMTLMAGRENVERWPWVWTSGDFSKECGASNLIDGNTNTIWIGNVGGEPWRVILDLGTVTDVTGIQLMFLDTAWTNKEIIGSRDSEVWFDYLAETNEWAPLRYLYVNFWGNEHGAQPPAIREIIWRDR